MSNRRSAPFRASCYYYCVYSAPYHLFSTLCCSAYIYQTYRHLLRTIALNPNLPTYLSIYLNSNYNFSCNTIQGSLFVTPIALRHVLEFG